MMDTTRNPDEHAADSVSPPVKLAELAVELDEPLEAIERDLAGHVFKLGGFRVCTAFQAAALIEERAGRRAEADAAAQRRGEAARQQREAARARAEAERQDDRTRVQQFGLHTTTIEPMGAEGVPPVVAMTAGADKDFEGGTMTPRPSRLDWITGKAEGGGTFGPSLARLRGKRKGGAK